MLSSMPFAIVAGCILGFLAGLGVGGGSLLILWLSLVLGMDHNVSRSINLMFFIPSAIIASLFRWKQGALPLKKVLPAVIGGCISAAVMTLLSGHIPLALIKKVFGWLLIATGLREVFYRARKAK